MKYNISIISDSIPGSNKKNNEDKTLILTSKSSIFICVFDGVGGAINGEVAPVLAIDYLKDNFPRLVQGLVGLADLMFETHLFLLSKGRPETLTTYCALHIPNDPKENCTFSTLGDSRLYTFNKQYIEQLSIDDSLSPGSNVITRSLGMLSVESTDFKSENVPLDSVSYLLCTDGFYNLMEQSRLKYFEILNSKTEDKIKKGLRDQVSGHNSDDASYIIFKRNV